MGKSIIKSNNNSLLKYSWELWNALIGMGLDTLFYDQEFLNGNTSFDGLGQNLGLKLTKQNVELELRKNNVSSSAFISSFFKTLQPYAQMMSDLCVFFAAYQVSSTNNNLKIVFDFKQQLSFDAENFHSTLIEYKKVKRKVTFYHFNNLWELSNIFSHYHHSHWNRKISDFQIQNWVYHYENGTYLSPNLILPETGFSSLDLLINRAFELWKSYVNACLEINSDVRIVKQLIREDEILRDKIEGDLSAAYVSNLSSSWSFQDLDPEFDNWSRIMLFNMTLGIEDLMSLPKWKQRIQIEKLTLSLSEFFGEHPQSEKEIDDTIQELFDLLNLPIWKKRHELFSTWILAVLDKNFTAYDRTLHHNNGVLLLKFTGTHLLTIITEKGPIELWAENRTPVVNPSGRGRKNNIQPDYTLNLPNATDPNNCIVCIEVKQYKKASVGNFRHAINDYAKGLINAYIVLLNYGPVPSKIVLDFPTRSSYYGGIKPGSLELEEFLNKLLFKMPIPKVPTVEELIKRELDKEIIDNVFVDVSGSMCCSDFWNYINALLENLIRDKTVVKLTALDDVSLFTWKSPDTACINELVNSHFYSGNDFNPSILKDKGHCVVITDGSHCQAIFESGNHPIVIVLDLDGASLYVYEIRSDTFELQSYEPFLKLMSTSWSLAGFEGKLRQTLKK